MNCEKCGDEMKKIEITDQVGDMAPTHSNLFFCEKCGVVFGVKEAVEKILRTAPVPTGIKALLMEVRGVLESPTLCVLRMSEHVFNLIKEGKVAMVDEGLRKPRRFKWVERTA